MKKSAADRNFNTCATTTTEDPIIRELRHQGQVFATDSILSTLMTASRSVNSWDIIVRRIGDKLFFDRRDGSEIDMVSVNETANEPPGEDNVGINDPRNLTLEATYINKVFIFDLFWPHLTLLDLFENSDSLPDYETACQMIASDKKTPKKATETTVTHNNESLTV